MDEFQWRVICVVIEGNEEVRNRKNLLPPLSMVASHFGTSGMSVALATGVTHPLG